MSDHFPCLLLLTIGNEKNKGDEIVIEKRKLTEKAIAKIQEKLLFQDWSCVTNLSVNDGYKFLLCKITEALDAYAPKKTIKVRVDEKFREPWLTVNIEKCNRKCQKLCNKAKMSGDNVDYVRYKTV